MPQPPEEDLFILPDEYASCSRHKRSLLKSHRNEELNVETLVVVDRKMIRAHGHENITTYVLTILNMVGRSFLLNLWVIPPNGVGYMPQTQEIRFICDDPFTLHRLPSKSHQNSREQSGLLCERGAWFEGVKVFIYQKSVRGS